MKLTQNAILLNAIHKTYIFCRFFFGGGMVVAVTCFWLCQTAGGILAPQAGTEAVPLAVKVLDHQQSPKCPFLEIRIM